VAPPSHPASQVGVRASYPDVPALIISGELDSITTPADGAAVAAAFPHGVQLRIANSFHVNAPAPGPQRLRRGNRPSVHHHAGRRGHLLCIASAAGAPRIAVSVDARDLTPAVGLTGNSASPRQLRIVSAAVQAAGDLLARVDANSTDQGRGLRGGTYRLKRSGASGGVSNCIRCAGPAMLR